MGPVVDVRTTVEIDRPRAEVAAFASDPDNVTAWYANITSVAWKSPPPLAVGTLLAFTARFLGRRLSYEYEVTQFLPGLRLVMRTARGPFSMETTYSWEDNASGGTTMALRNRGEPSGLSRLVAPIMAVAVRRANTKDLARLKARLEHGA